MDDDIAIKVEHVSKKYSKSLKRSMFNGEKGRYLLLKYTLGLTLAFAILQSYYFAKWLQISSNFSGLDILSIYGLPLVLTIVATLTCSVFLLLSLCLTAISVP